MTDSDAHSGNGCSANACTLSSLWMYIKFSAEIFNLFLYTIWIFVKKIAHIFIRVQPKSLKDEIILVTGGANGIGLEICRKLVKVEPYLTIVIWDVDEVRTKAAVQELKDLGIYKAYGDKVDVSNRDQVQKAGQRIRDQCGDVTILFNNAGIAGGTGEGWKIESKLIEKVFEVNLISHCWTLQEFLPAMIRNGRGHVVETCSFLGIIWGAGGSAYIASKHGLKAYVECIKEDLRHLPEKPKIIFTLAYPQNTLTNMTAKVNFKSKTYPFLVNQLLPRDVASKMVEGMLRNDEHVYIPEILRTVPAIMGTIPPQVMRKIADISKIDFDVPSANSAKSIPATGDRLTEDDKTEKPSTSANKFK